MAERDPKASSRILVLDALRGIAVCLMVEQHLGVWLWTGPGKGERLSDYPLHILASGLGGGAAPCFIILAGIGASLMASRYPADAKGRVLQRGLAAVSLRRGLVLLAFALGLNFAVPSWFTWKSFYVLHLMGVGLCLSAVLHRLSTRQVLLCAAGLWLASGLVQTLLEIHLDPGNAHMSGRSKARLAALVDAQENPSLYLRQQLALTVRIALAEGHFPIFPWLSLFVVGMACGRWVARGELHRLNQAAAAMLVLGVIGPLLSLANDHLDIIDVARGSWAHRAARLNAPFFPASPAMVALLGAIITWVCTLAIRLESRRPLSETNVLVTLGRVSLSLLIFHLVVFREWTRPIDVWRELDITTTYIVCLLFLVIAAWVSRQWASRAFIYGAEWWLRTLGGKSPRPQP